MFTGVHHTPVLPSMHSHDEREKPCSTSEGVWQNRHLNEKGIRHIVTANAFNPFATHRESTNHGAKKNVQANCSIPLCILCTDNVVKSSLSTFDYGNRWLSNIWQSVTAASILGHVVFTTIITFLFLVITMVYAVGPVEIP